MNQPGQLLFTEVTHAPWRWAGIGKAERNRWRIRENKLYSALCAGRSGPQSAAAKRIISAVAAEFSLQAKSLSANGRWEPLPTARHVAIYLLSIEGFGHHAISHALGMERTSVLYGRAAIINRLPLEPALRAKFEKLCSVLKINPGDTGVNKP